jgi:uncharacterized protein YbjT (DUF2867 family)
LNAGEQARIFVRDANAAHAHFGDAVELAQGNFADPRSVRAALDGVEQLFLSGPDDPRRVAWETDAIDAAVASGVRRIVKLSSIGAEPGATVAFWDWHGRVEQHLRQSGVCAEVLRPSFYMSNLLASADQVAAEGRLFAPAGQARIAMIDPRDVGAAAAVVLCTAGHDGRSCVLTGPESITYTQVAAHLSAATDREIEYDDAPDGDARRAMIQAGLPGFAAEQVVKLFAMLRRGAAEPVTATVESLTGRPPREFASFAREHARLFTPSAVGAAR